MKNADDDIVWVISTPADRSILQEEIPVGGFVFPASTQDGDTVFNDVTGLWYVYNGAKNQWIDLPPGERELSYPGTLRQADSAIDETYEGEADAADGDVYLNASRPRDWNAPGRPQGRPQRFCLDRFIPNDRMKATVLPLFKPTTTTA